MKDRGKNRPTVTSPKEYKNRFRAAMSKYVLQAPTYVIFSLPSMMSVKPDAPVAAGISSTRRSTTFVPMAVTTLEVCGRS